MLQKAKMEYVKKLTDTKIVERKKFISTNDVFFVDWKTASTIKAANS